MLFALLTGQTSVQQRLTNAWTFLLFIAGIGRIALALIPHASPWFMFGILIVSLIWALWQIKQHSLILGFDNIFTFLVLLFIMIRNFHPQFDVDSLGYHLLGILWLYHRPEFPAIYQIIENTYIPFRFIGFEDFLLVSGLPWDLAFFAGLIGGLLKCLTLVTIVSLTPLPWRALSYLSVFLVLIDDHFFFSGQSTHVYLNPGFIGIVALSFFHCWRTLRGHSASAWNLLILTPGVSASKYHGLYFAMFFSFVLIVFFLKKIIGRIYKGPNWDFKFRFASNSICFFAMFGLNWLETGSPLYPLALGPFRAWSNPIGLQNFLPVFPSGSFFMSIAHPIKSMVWPGNLSLKIAAVLVFPVAAVYIYLRIFRKNPLKALLLRERPMSLACFGFTVSLAWVCLAEMIVSNESRYPRYIYGFTVIAIAAFLSAVRPRRFSTPLWNQKLFGLAVLGYLIFTIDTRYINVPVANRPHWEKILHFLKLGKPDPLAANSLAYRDLFEDFSKQNIIPLSQCYNGDGIQAAVYSPIINWPGYLLAPFALRADGFAWLQLPKNIKNIDNAGIRYFIFPKSMAEFQDFPNPITQELFRKASKSRVICETEKMLMVDFFYKKLSK